MWSVSLVLGVQDWAHEQGRRARVPGTGMRVRVIVFNTSPGGPACPVTLIDHLHVVERHSIVAATDVRPKITLACQECKHRNYITKKNRRNDPDRLEMKKFCPNCGTHRLHKETR